MMRWRVLAALLLAFPLMSARAADGDELTRDLLRIHNSTKGHEFAFWLPAAAVTTLVPSTNPEAARAIKDAFAGYELFLVEHTTEGVAQDVDAAALMPVRFKLGDGRVLDAMQESDMPPNSSRSPASSRRR